MMEIHVDESSTADGVLLVRVRPYMLIAIGCIFTLGSCIGFVYCFAPFDHAPYDKICLDDEGKSAFLPLVASFFAGFFVLHCFVSWGDFRFNMNIGELKITQRHVFGGTIEDTMNLCDIREVAVVENGSGGATRVEMKTDRLAIPLTSYYSSGRSEHNRAAVVIERFLGLTPNDNLAQNCRCRYTPHHNHRNQELRPILHANDTEAPGMRHTIANVEAVTVQDDDVAPFLPVAVATPAMTAEVRRDDAIIAHALPLK